MASARWYRSREHSRLIRNCCCLTSPSRVFRRRSFRLIAEGVASIRAMGKGVLIAESNIHHIPDYVDRIYVLERGEVMFSGTLAQAQRDRDVMRVIAGQIEVAL